MSLVEETGTPASALEDGLLQMSIEDKAGLTAGDDVWHLAAVPGLGLGRLAMSDGPSGLRGERRGLSRALAFPCGTAVGATWDVDLAHRYGQALGGEALDHGVQLLLGPTVCIARTPVAGRTFEGFSEDPWLTSALAVAYIRGVQSRGVGCCVKHFACNDQEHERMSISAVVAEGALREIHLPAFEAAVKQAGVWAVMSAYNGLNGEPCSENEVLLTRILKEEWGFDGVVISDWLGTYHPVAPALAGIDVEMPGPARYMGHHLVEAVRSGQLPEATLDHSVRRILHLIDRAGVGLVGAERRHVELDDPDRRALAREIATGATVLLSNDGILPFQTGLRRVAVIGPNADHLQTGGGGSSLVLPLRESSLVDELRQSMTGVDVVYEPGCRIDRGAAPLDSRVAKSKFRLQYFTGLDSTDALGEDSLWGGTFITTSPPCAGVTMDGFAVRARGSIAASVSGTWQFSLANTGRAKVLLDGAVVVDNSAPIPGDSIYGYGSAPVTADVDLVAGVDREVLIEMETGGLPVGGFSLALRAPEEPGLMERAEAAARDADAVVLVVGNDPEWETEGKDRPDIKLFGAQAELVDRVLAANPRTIVVVNAGAPVEMPWADRAAANLVTWFPGEEGAAALAGILTGATEPGGRLPLTFPKRLEDVRAHHSYPGANGTVVYSEGLMVGYRHFDDAGVEPAYCFGHGLTYTTFDYGTPSVEVDGRSVRAVIPVTNIGARDGTEVVQLYVGRPDSAGVRPPQELKAFEKIRLAAGETAAVALQLDARSFATWDEAEHAWKHGETAFELLFAASSRDVRQRARIDLTRPAA
ncbi:MAG TPA: glycoside hydrolase family 3 C-terminal domain-containing protein [Candidatus Solibacter sp.]|jgi:beta-glucosidase|nr:glycoside hydrolase family 3 C-terminal domain-containing protein [Candidatus Solibacter sp.]